MDNTSTLLIGFGELATVLNRPLHAVRTAYANGFIPLASELRGGARCFNRNEAAIVAACLPSGGDRD